MKETRKRLLGWFLTVAMTLSLTTGLMPVSASAEAKASDGDMVLNKTATLGSDGTYTINLEAYATGLVETVTKTTPTDVVLLLDMSGSMDEDMGKEVYVLYTDRVTDLMEETYYHLCADGSYTEVETYHVHELNPLKDGIDPVTGENIDNTNRYRFLCPGCGYTRKHDNPFFDNVASDWQLYTKQTVDTGISRLEALKTAASSFVTTMAEKNANLTDESQKHRLAIVKFAGELNDKIGDDTYYDYYEYNYTQIVKQLAVINNDTASEYTTAITNFKAGGATSVDYGMQKVEDAFKNSDADREKVVILFTDGEPTHNNGFENEVAANTINAAQELKAQGVKIFTISTVSTANPDDTTVNKMDMYMNAVSSNYPDASAVGSDEGGWNGGDWVNQGYLNITFGEGSNQGYYKATTDADQLESIFEEISESIGGTTVTLDANSVLKDIMATGFQLSDSYTVTVQTDNVKEFDSNGTPVWANNPQTLTGANVTPSSSAVSVSGFDYKSHYVAQGAEGVVGQKLIVTITGVEATDAATTDELISTNDVESGIYANSETETPAFTFPQPQTYIPSKTFVLDYGKAAVLDGWNTSEDNAGKSYTTTAPTTLDVEKMGWFNTSTPIKEGTDTYGSVSLNGETLTYTPGTMNWDGYDSFYVFGRWDTNSKPAVTTGDNVWTRVNVVPANNVYYEDDFQAVGNGVKIEYGGGTWTKIEDVNQTSYTQTIDNEPYGWVDTTNTTYSDGSAHATGEKGATATFTFTGTGVDVYSRTNMQSGTVYAKICEKGNPVATKMLIVDGQAVSGDYYQIPTVFFNVPYGTYTVTITVLTGAGTDGAATYYLDGVRVYNPVEIKESDPVVSDAYDADGESGAVWNNVRDILIGTNGDTFAPSGAVFIDKIPDEEGNETNEIATYQDYGPKNEVYLDQGQSIVIKLHNADPNAHYYVGLKAMSETSAEVTNGEGKSPLIIDSTMDRYYKVTPGEDGYIMIQNTGEGLLAVTKLRCTAGGAVQEVDTVGVLSYANTFDTLPVVAYAGQESTVETPEIVVEEEDGYKSRVESWLEKLFSGASRWL